MAAERLWLNNQMWKLYIQLLNDADNDTDTIDNSGNWILFTYSVPVTLSRVLHVSTYFFFLKWLYDVSSIIPVE